MRVLHIAAAAALLAAPALTQAQPPWAEQPGPPPPWAEREAPSWLKSSGPEPAFTADEIAPAAHRLEERAIHFYRVISDVEPYSHIEGDARRLARSARHFHRVVEQSPSYDHLMSDFVELQRQFHHTRAALFRAHRTHHVEHVVRDWLQVSASYERVALAVGLDDQMLCEPDHYDEHRGTPARPYYYERRRGR